MTSPAIILSPTSALIDDSYNLTVSWQPPVPSVLPFAPAYDQYVSWGIVLNGASPIVISAPPSYAGTPLTFTSVLTAGSWTLDMQTSVALSPIQTYDWQEYNTIGNVWVSVSTLIPPYLAFPDAIVTSDVVFSTTTLELGQPLNVTLQPVYTNADQWQVLWPDGTSTGWLPLSANALTKQFQIAGALDVVIQTRKLYNSATFNPPVILMRQLSVQIFVADQEFTGSTASSGSLSGTLGIGGQQGFEITGATSAAVVPNPWETIARAIVRDTITNELKLLVASSRSSNASSLLGTMAIDVFPMEGRPKAKELIVPVYENGFNALTSSTPVNITTTQLPTNLYVGKPIAEFQMTATGGTPQYSWFTDGLPQGLKLSINGVLSGTPLALGTSSINFAVQDSSIPFYIAETSLPVVIATDLLVIVAAGQTDANHNPILQLGASLGVAQVNTPYSVQMQVGNVNSSVSTSGGLPPYTWSIPAGALPIGLSINPATGLISGTPSTYNSTTDFSKTFSAVVQVTDAVGAIATKTYTMTLEPAVLQFGSVVDQGIIYAGQQFKLTIPIFGGQSPYSFDPGTQFAVPPVDSTYYSTPALVDGQIEVDVNFPLLATGTHTFLLQVTDNLGHHPSALPTQFTINVEPALSDPFLVPAFVDHVWGNPDVAKVTPLPITGTFSGFQLGGVSAALTQVANASSGNTTYTGVFGPTTTFTPATTFFAVSGFQNPTNNGTFAVMSNTSTQLVLNNPAGVAEGPISYSFALSHAAAAVAGSVNNPAAPFTTTTTYTFTTPQPTAAGNSLAGLQFTVTGFSLSSGINNGTFYCTESTTTTLTLSNTAGVTETAAGSAAQLAAKALQVTTMANGVSVGVDPNIPEVEFTGTSSGVFGNAQYTLPIALTLNGFTPATFSQTYTTISEDNSSPTWAAGDIGALAINTRPYSVSQFVGLNPREPYFNSPNVPSLPVGVHSPPIVDLPWLAVVQNGSNLPLGLSLDTNTGLIYGTLVGVATGTSVIQYIGSTGTIHGAATITWNTLPQNSFSPIDNISDGILTGTNLTGTTSQPTSYITVPNGITPTAASIYYGRLPNGLTLNPSPTGQNFFITGAATEGGYFDVWFQIVSATGTAYLYHRFSIGFNEPLIIATSALPTASAQPYFAQLQGFGGIPPYTWSSPTNFPSGVGTGGFAGLTLNSSTGIISGTLTTPPVSSPTDLGDINVTLTDSRGTAVTDGVGYLAPLHLIYNNGLRIITPTPNGVATIFAADPQDFSFQMEGAGGVPPYSWEISPATPLPSGITPTSGTSWNGAFVLQSSGGGLFGGSWPGSPAYIPNPTPITVFLKDSVPTTVNASFNIVTSASAPPIGINPSGAGPIPRGEPYNGLLAVTGPYVLPVAWYAAPTTAWPNTLPAGLSIQANGSGATAGATATISGTYSGVPLTNYQVRFIAVDNTLTDGQTAEVVVTFNTDTNLTITGWDTVPPTNSPNGYPFPLPNAVITGSYGPIQLIATHGVPVGTNTDGYGQYKWVFSGTVNTSGTAVTWVSTPPPNDNFPTTLAGTILVINGVNYTVLTVNSPTSITLTSSAGTQSGVPYTTSQFPFNGISLAGNGVTSGQLSGTATSLFSQDFAFTVGDSLPSPNYFTLHQTLSSQASGLAINNTSLPNAVAGVPYSVQLTASGGSGNYTFSVFSGTLPSGLSLSSAGLISGTTLQVGYSQVITFRVTDTSTSAYSNKPLNLTVVSGLTLHSGIDYADSLSTGSLGYVDAGNVVSISPRPNSSFFVIATGVVSNSPGQLQIILSGGFSSNVTSLVGGVASIQITGPFASGTLGSNSLSISVTDSGVTATATFTWVVYQDGILRLAPSSGSIPTKLVTPS